MEHTPSRALVNWDARLCWGKGKKRNTTKKNKHNRGVKQGINIQPFEFSAGPASTLLRNYILI
jgi:hypothetical protein